MQKIISSAYVGNLFLGVISFMFLANILQADPWGKDADLVEKKVESCPSCKCTTFLLGPLSECLIGFHQNVISHADGPRSHYKPSSSQYTLEAMRKYGFACGFMMGCDRLMRENNDPWVYPVVTDSSCEFFKWDPVP